MATLIETFNDWLKWLSEYAHDNPGQFIFTIILILSPFFALSAHLSYKLAKHIEKEEKKKAKKSKMIDNIKANNVPGRRIK